MNLRPWIGVRGCVSSFEVGGLVSIIQTLTHDPVRALGVIVNVNDATLAESDKEAAARCGDYDKAAKGFPRVKELPRLLTAHSDVLNFVYVETKDRMNLGMNLERVVAAAGPALSGVHIGMDWPPREALCAFRGAHPELRVVLRLTRDGVRLMQKQKIKKGTALAAAIAGRIASYDVTDVHLNLSGPVDEGGTPFDAPLLAEYLRAIRKCVPAIGLGVAGGLNGAKWKLKPVESLLREFPNLSLSAAAALMAVGSGIAVDAAMIFYRNAETTAYEIANEPPCSR